MRRLLPLLLCCACGRDLAVPTEALPPKIASVVPASGFAGDQVTLTGENLADPAIQIFFDVRPAVVLTPAGKRDGHTLLVEVPADVLSTAVSVTTTQGAARWDQPFTYLGRGHPATVALRATLSLAPDVAAVSPLPGGAFAVLDQRYGTARLRAAGGALGPPLRVGERPVAAFGPPGAAWVVDSSISGNALQRVDLSTDVPSRGVRLPFSLGTLHWSGSPSGTRFAMASFAQVKLMALPSGATQDIALPDDVAAVFFQGDDTLVGLTKSKPFRIDLSGASPVLTLGAALDAGADPDQPPIAAVDAGRLAYASHGVVRLLEWAGAGVPALSPAVFNAHVFPILLTFTNGGSTLLVGGPDVVAACEVSSGKLLSAQPLPGVSSLASIAEGDEQGFVIAATGNGTALLFPSGQLLRSDVIGVGLGSIAVDPACGDVLVASDFGPLQVTHDTLQPLALDVSQRLDGVHAGEGGVVAFQGQTIFAYQPPANCRGAGSLVPAGQTTLSPIWEAALSNDGNWVAVTDNRHLELVPRSAAAGQRQSLDYLTNGGVYLAYAQNQLTATHPAAGKQAISNFKPGTLVESASFALPDDVVALRRVRFAGAWMVDDALFDAQTNRYAATHVTIWSEATGVLAEETVPATVTVPSGISADGFMLVGISQVGANYGLDTLILQVSQGKLVQQIGPHVDLPSVPEEIYASPDGGRFYVSIPGTSALAVVE